MLQISYINRPYISTCYFFSLENKLHVHFKNEDWPLHSDLVIRGDSAFFYPMLGLPLEWESNFHVNQNLTKFEV